MRSADQTSTCTLSLGPYFPYLMLKVGKRIDDTSRPHESRVLDLGPHAGERGKFEPCVLRPPSFGGVFISGTAPNNQKRSMCQPRSPDGQPSARPGGSA